MDRISLRFLTKTTCSFSLLLPHLIAYPCSPSRAQYAILTTVLGIKKAYAVIGFSMGGQQAYYWPVMYPDFVERYGRFVSYLQGLFTK